MKIFLDDVRTPPDGWILVNWPQQAINYLKTNKVTEISLDHDLGDDSIGTGYDVVTWIEEQVMLHGFVPPKITVHSANVSAKSKMEMGIAKIMSVAHTNGNTTCALLHIPQSTCILHHLYKKFMKNEKTNLGNKVVPLD